jgi:RNA polymerase sigma-70 factor (ECF subfamily)
VSFSASVPDDGQLVRNLARRDEAALMTLYARYGGPVYSLAVRILRDPGPAEEVTQDVFLKLWRDPTRWDATLGQFSSWLLAVTRNAAIDRLRAERRRLPPLAVELTDLNEPGAAEPALSQDTLWFDGQLLRRLMQSLPPEQRELIELAFFGGYTHTELAELLQLPLGTVKTRLRAGLQKLRTQWQEATRR